MRLLLVRFRRIPGNFIRVDVHDPCLLAGCIKVVDDEGTGVPIVSLVGFWPHGPPAKPLAVDRHLNLLAALDRTRRVRLYDIWLVIIARFELHVVELAAKRARRFGWPYLAVLRLLSRTSHNKVLLHNVCRVLGRVR